MAVYLAKGMRDFLPADMILRNEVMGQLRAVFETWGFEPLATPAVERIETLKGKYGEEGDKLLFQILKRGAGGARGEVDQGLRYDLTVPLARVLAMHPELPMPFRRYQIQPVWRAERPQRGRFREFFQCDVDIAGAEVGVPDAECLGVAQSALQALGFERFTIRVNHRGILRSICARLGELERETPVLVAIDKLDKIGREGVSRELSSLGLSEEKIGTLWGLLAGEGDPLERLEQGLDEAGLTAIAELRQVLSAASELGVTKLQVDPTLARGLSYYTGPIFEARLEDQPGLGSVSGGGRYDGLVGMFCGRSIPAVGVSLGLERLLVAMRERAGSQPPRSLTKVYVTVFSEDMRGESLRQLSALRAAGIPSQIHLGRAGKLGKQFRRAQQQGVPWVMTCGPDEAAKGSVRLKNLDSGLQEDCTLEEAIARLR